MNAPRAAAFAVLLLLLLPVVVAQGPGAAPTATSHETATLAPAVFRTNAPVAATVTVQGLLVSNAGGSPVQTITVTLPGTAVLSESPTAPAGWTITRDQSQASPPSVEYTSLAPGSQDEAVFPITLQSISCPNGFATHAWSIVAKTVAGASRALSASHRCDNRAPVLVAAGPATATTESGEVTLATVSDDSSFTQTATIVRPDGTSLTQTSSTSTLKLAIPKTGVGAWRYHVDVVDAAGNALRIPATGQSTLAVADATLPVVELSAPGLQEAGAPHLVFFNFTDNVAPVNATLRWRVDAGAWTSVDVFGKTQQSLPGVSDWQKTVEVELFVGDAAANVGRAAATAAFADRLPPLPAATFADPTARGWNSATVPVAITATDAGSPRLTVNYTRMTRAADGTWTFQNASAATRIDLSLAGSAEHILYWGARDDAGNVANGGPRIVRVDPAAPTATLENLTAGWVTSPLWITFRPTAPLSGLAAAVWRVNEAEQPERSRRFDADGTYELRWNATSVAGVDAAGTGTLRMDVTPPTVDVQAFGDVPSNGKGHRGNVTVTLAAADATTGIASLAFELNGATAVAYAAPFTLREEGAYTVKATARDGAGHATSQSLSILIDRTAPRLEILVNGTGTGALFNHSAAVTLRSDDNLLTGLACTLNGAAANAAAGFNVATDGVHTVACSATDAVGNPASVQRTFAVDAAPPVLGAPTDLGMVRSVAPAVTVTDAASGVATVEGLLTLPDGTTRSVAMTRDGATHLWRMETIPLADGRHTLAVRATDPLGRATAWTSVLSFHLVSGAPVATVHMPNNWESGVRGIAEIHWTLAPHPVNATMIVSVDGADATPMASPLVIDKRGVTKVSMRVRDDLGNLGPERKFDILVDPTALEQGSSTEQADNRRPTVAAVTLRLSAGRVLATPEGVGDPDGDKVTLYYRWRVNGTVVSGANGASIPVQPGQRIVALVTPWDGRIFGFTTESAELTIEAPKTIPAEEDAWGAALQILGGMRVNETLTFTAGFSGSRATASHRWTFSDGHAATTATVRHAFRDAGAAWAEVVLTDTRGQTHTLRRNFTIAADAPTVAEPFVWRSPAGVPYTLNAYPADRTRILREIPSTLAGGGSGVPSLLLQSGDDVLLWTPATGDTLPVARAEATPGEPAYGDGSQIVPLHYRPSSGWLLLRLLDPQPGLPEPSATPAADAFAWRDGGDVLALVRATGVDLAYDLETLVVEATATEIERGVFAVNATALGGGPIDAFRVTLDDRVIAQGAGRALAFRHEVSAGEEILRVTARTADGQEATKEVRLVRAADPKPTPGTPTPTPPTGGNGTPKGNDTPGKEEDDKDTPAPGALVVGLALLGAALLARRRRPEA